MPHLSEPFSISIAKESALPLVRAIYDLHLTRTIRYAGLWRAPTFESAVELFLSERLDAVAGLRQPLEVVSRATVGLHVIEGRFDAVEQGIAVPKGRGAGLRYLNAYLDQMKTSDRVTAALQRACVVGASSG